MKHSFRRISWLTVIWAAAPIAFAQWYPMYPPPPPMYYNPPPSYRQGPAPSQPERQEGEDVRRAQQQLQELGYHRGSIDGIAGPNTRSALARFQAERGLTPDGVLGPATKRELDRLAGGSAGNREVSVRRESAPQTASRARTETTTERRAGPSASASTGRRSVESTESSDQSTEAAVSEDEVTTQAAAPPRSAVPAASRTIDAEPVPLDEAPAETPVVRSY